MPIIFRDILTTPAGSSAYLLDDNFTYGGFRVLQKISDRDKLLDSACKIGMLVKVVEDGLVYELKEFKIEYDEDWNEVVTKVWEEFKFVHTEIFEEPTAQPLTRWVLPVRSTLIAPKATYQMRIPVSYLTILETLSVDKICKVSLRETDNPLQLGDGAQFNQTIEHEFVAGKLTFDPAIYFPDGVKVRTRYTQMFANKDPNKDRYIYLTIENTGLASTNITARFLFVSMTIA